MSELTEMARSKPFWLLFSCFALVPGICEELFFRGMLQRSLGSSPAAVTGVAVAFSLYHIDPHHVMAALPIGIYLGWLAVRTGSTLVPIGGHVTNNCFAVIAANLDCLSFGYGTDRSIPLWYLLLTLAVTAACVAIVSRGTSTAQTTADC